MAKNTKKIIKAGDRLHIYLPKDASDRAIEWLNNQSSVGAGIIELIENHIDEPDEKIVKLDAQTRRLITHEINKTLEEIFSDVQFNSNRPIKLKKAGSDADKLYKMPPPDFTV